MGFLLQKPLSTRNHFVSLKTANNSS